MTLYIPEKHDPPRRSPVNGRRRFLTQFSRCLTSFGDIRLQVLFRRRTHQPNDDGEGTWCGSYYFFQRLKLFAIFTKHRGFKEEDEWRVVYMRDRDQGQNFDKMFSYWVGPRGVESKLKLKIAAIPGLPETNLTLSTIVERILLGPSLSSPLARGTIFKMLDTLGLSDLKDRIKASSIPLRAGRGGKRVRRDTPEVSAERKLIGQMFCLGRVCKSSM
jgi:hypothetical protein